MWWYGRVTLSEIDFLGLGRTNKEIFLERKKSAKIATLS
jgi:hypothetical protein